MTQLVAHQLECSVPASKAMRGPSPVPGSLRFGHNERKGTKPCADFTIAGCELQNVFCQGLQARMLRVKVISGSQCVLSECVEWSHPRQRGSIVSEKGADP